MQQLTHSSTCLSQLKDGVVPASQLKDSVAPASQLKDSVASASQLKDAVVSASQLPCSALMTVAESACTARDNPDHRSGGSPGHLLLLCQR